MDVIPPLEQVFPPFAGDAGERHRRRALVGFIRQAVCPVIWTGLTPAEASARGPLDLLTEVEIEGSAFLAHPEGFYLTAAHVIKRWLRKPSAGEEPARPQLLFLNEVSLTAPGNAVLSATAGVVGGFRTAEDLDIAALWLAPTPPHAPTIHHLPLSPEACEEGDRVLACGYPFGMHLRRSGAEDGFVGPQFTEGIVSKVMPYLGATPAQRHLIQFDAAINAGSSGGPLIDPVTGLVVGIVIEANTLIGPGATRVHSGLANAVPIHHGTALIERLRKEVAAALDPAPRGEPPTPPT